MNDDKCDCWASIPEDSERAELWRPIIPDLRIPLKHPLLIPMSGPEGVMRFYEGDPSKLTGHQHRDLALAMKAKFGISVEAVISDLQNGLLPIKAEGCTVHWCAFHSRFISMNDGQYETLKESYRGVWIARWSGKKFHYVINGKSLCGKKLNETDSELPKYYLIPMVEHICKRCSNSLFRIGSKKKHKEVSKNERRTI